jgi:nicotinamide riboside transporter PnuC
MIKWIATILCMIGGILISINIQESKYAFPFFILSNLLFVYKFYQERDYALTANNAFFLLLNAIGIFRWFF